MRRVLASACLAVAMSGAVGACGGEDAQDADEPSGEFDVRVVRAEFPRSQSLARQTEMVMAVRNTGDRTIPNLAVTVQSFAARTGQAGSADPSRPVWIIDEMPRNGETAYVDTYTAGPLRPGRTASLRWKVTPVVAGRQRVRWSVAAGLHGKARARGADGEAPRGEFVVDVSREPEQATVDPDSGEVVRSAGGSSSGT